PGNYRLLFTSSSLAWGQAENVAVAYSGGAVDLSKKNVELTVTLVPAAKVTGKVLGPSGPLWGARVRAGLATTITNQDGSFTLEGVTPGAVTVSVGKTLYEGTSRATEVSAGATRDLGNISLASKPNPAYYLYNPNDLLEGKTVRVAFSQLFSRLNAAGFSEGGSEARIWFLANPALTEAQCQELQSFVQSGGKVIFLGEWGGYAGARPDDANRLLNRFGLGLNADLVRSTSNLGRLEWILARDFNFPRPQPVDAIALFASASTYGVPPAWSIASAGTSAYRVMSGGVSVASAAQDGDGLVVAVGDASGWADFASASGVNNNLEQQYNWNFMLNLFQW
ncbi:MAG: carboxypeptidase regulatory-like domain-containing protein, partial [Bacteroidota bacterium]